MEDLGTRTINGVAAQGVRITITIPADNMGNESEIPTVTERWVASELQVLVKSFFSVPSFVTTTFELTDINPAAPDPSLFQVPGSYVQRKGGDRGNSGQGITGYQLEVKGSAVSGPPAKVGH